MKQQTWWLISILRGITLTPFLIEITEKMNEFGLLISIQQWKTLTHLQRFALLKLSRPGHESKNFPKAMKEFGLIQGEQKVNTEFLSPQP